MNRSALKTYAPKARREFIQAVTDRAAFYGLTKDETQPVTVKGDVAIIGGKAFPRSVAEKRAKLEDRIERLGPGGFERTMEAVAYTWFNRLVAIRYMELHGYLDHGYRVLSHPEGKATPEIVEHAEHVELPGLNSQKAIELKLDGTKEAELFRMLLLAQCNALHAAMPFLFERIDDETELLLPENLLHSDSIVRKLVSEIDEADWQEVEIIGWLYQFYISEKKDEVIGKVVKSEDIPAATQLFTPNWIVKYLVQNSLGRQWLATYSESSLKSKWEYFIEPAKQTPEVQAKLKEITPATLNPEDLTIMDPACGSGHILVEAYDLLKDIYLERGYRLRDIPRLILTKNVYGLEIDDRAAQLACFALLMKARADDRKIFDPPPQLNVLAIQETNGLDIPTIVQAFTDKRITKDDDLPAGEFGFMVAERAPLFAGESKATPAKADEQVAADLKVLLALFENAKTFGSLITIPPRLAERLPKIAEAVEAAKADSNLAVQNAARIAGGFVMTAKLLTWRVTCAIANPPYMGSKYYAPLLKAFVNAQYPEAKADLYACFMHRNASLAQDNGWVGMITIPNWMFLSSFEALRRLLLKHQTVDTLLHNGRGVFGSDFGSCAFTLRNAHVAGYQATYRRLFDKQGSVSTNEELETKFHTVPSFSPSCRQFLRIPGSPIAYWVSRNFLAAFEKGRLLEQVAELRQGMATADNGRFVRYWYEVPVSRIGFGFTSRESASSSGRKWFPYTNGGEYRKWYGNLCHVVNWEHDGRELFAFKKAAVRNPDTYFRRGITWSSIGISALACRSHPAGGLFSNAGMVLFADDQLLCEAEGFLNSCVGRHFLAVLCPTVNFGVGEIGRLPLVRSVPCSEVVQELEQLAKADWDSTEVSWDFQSLALVDRTSESLQAAQLASSNHIHKCVCRMMELEQANNVMFLKAYGLQGELAPDVEEEQITISRPSRENDALQLISYSLGCAMGRYSLDTPGLIYAHSGNEGFDPSQYKTLPADPDGIIPITEHDWFPDSAARRFEEFVGVAWPKEHLEENLQFVADSLTGKSVSDPRETIRSYFANDFYKHHLQTYKKRPIYWLFSSGKQRAFQALVYLHRYHEGTLARMRTEYVIPLQGKIASRIAQLEGDISKATSSAHGKKLTKEKDALEKQRVELLAFDEKLRHYADQRIKLDLDDGVKVNYGKFGDLLAEVKAICGEKEEEE
ncbi:MAG: BREX-1 system adenine-specific DNA-methyltransferase PglX [Phycisphaerales bacterium]